MDFEIELTGTDANEQTTLSLQDWIKNEQIEEMSVKRKSGIPQKGDMGADPLTILSVVLAAPAVVELVKSIHVWIQSRKPKCKIKISGSGNVVELDSENIPELQSLLDKFKDFVGG